MSYNNAWVFLNWIESNQFAKNNIFPFKFTWVSFKNGVHAFNFLTATQPEAVLLLQVTRICPAHTESDEEVAAGLLHALRRAALKQRKK